MLFRGGDRMLVLTEILLIETDRSGVDRQRRFVVTQCRFDSVQVLDHSGGLGLPAADFIAPEVVFSSPTEMFFMHLLIGDVRHGLISFAGTCVCRLKKAQFVPLRTNSSNGPNSRGRTAATS